MIIIIKYTPALKKKKKKKKAEIHWLKWLFIVGFTDNSVATCSGC